MRVCTVQDERAMHLFSFAAEHRPKFSDTARVPRTEPPCFEGQSWRKKMDTKTQYHGEGLFGRHVSLNRTAQNLQVGDVEQSRNSGDIFKCEARQNHSKCV